MKKKIVLLIILVLLSLFFIFAILIFSPVLETNGQNIQIQSEESIDEIGQDLKSHNIIPSVFLFKAWMIFSGADKNIIPGEYFFDTDSSIFVVVKRISTADYGIAQSKITIPEGSTISEIGLILQKTYPDVDLNSFSIEGASYEGYLFPDTYNLFVSTSIEDIIQAMRDNFDVKTKELRDQAGQEGKDWNSIIIMASILEEEGRAEEDRKIIAGILYKRIEAGIALQVDATFRHINGKTTSDLTLDDLQLDSPYNTYTNTGLPPGPISNPGLESIEAAINPTTTDYLYFLTGNDGKMYYARTFEEHVENKRRYLN